MPERQLSSNVVAFPGNMRTAMEGLPAARPDFKNDVLVCEARVHSLLAAGRLEAALDFLSRSIVWHPRSRELHYIYAVCLLDLGEFEKAAAMARRLVFLAPRAVAAHMLLGTIAQQQGDCIAAMRAYRNGLSFCHSVPENEIVPLTGNARYGRVAAALQAEIASLQATSAAGT